MIRQTPDRLDESRWIGRGRCTVPVAVAQVGTDLAKAYRYFTPLKIINLIPPVTSKFTLFVKRPERTDGSHAGYNRLRNSYDGSPLAASVDFRPLVLRNDDNLPLKELGGRGFVLLGGDDPVELQITSGSDANQGESFHFQALTEMRERASGGTDPLSEGLLGNYASGQTRYLLKRSFQGFFESDSQGATMNGSNRLKRYLGSGRTTSSNLLHLYGTWQQRSPTMVVGPVYRSYALLSALVADTNADGKTDAVITILPGLDWQDYPWQISPFPASVQSRTSPGEWIDVKPLKSSDPRAHDYTHVFGDHSAYEGYMSSIVDDEPYNRSYDFMAGYQQGQLSAPRTPESSRHTTSGRSFGLEFANKDPHFQGDLNALGTATLEARVVAQVADGQEFGSRFLREGRLKLGCVVLVEKGDLVLPPRVQVEEGGVVLVKGNVIVSVQGVDCKSRS